VRAVGDTVADALADTEGVVLTTSPLGSEMGDDDGRDEAVAAAAAAARRTSVFGPRYSRTGFKNCRRRRAAAARVQGDRGKVQTYRANTEKTREANGVVDEVSDTAALQAKRARKEI